MSERSIPEIDAVLAEMPIPDAAWRAAGFWPDYECETLADCGPRELRALSELDAQSEDGKALVYRARETLTLLENLAGSPPPYKGGESTGAPDELFVQGEMVDAPAAPVVAGPRGKSKPKRVKV